MGEQGKNPTPILVTFETDTSTPFKSVPSSTVPPGKRVALKWDCPAWRQNLCWWKPMAAMMIHDDSPDICWKPSKKQHPFFASQKKISRSLNNKKYPKLFKRFPHACSTSIIKFTTAGWGIETPHSTGWVGCTILHTLGRWCVHLATLRPKR